MKLNKFTTIFTTVAVTATAIGMTAPQANAGTLKGGWNYAIDSFNDGTEGNTIGQESAFEFYGIAIKEGAEKIYVALNSNLALNGKAYSSAGNGLVGYGDLFFNFTDKNFNKASNKKKLFAIRFDDKNDAEVNSTGVYSNVKAKSVTRTNVGYGSLSSHANAVRDLGGSASMADLAQDDNYFKNQTKNVIKKGRKIGDIEYINDFSQLNLDFGQFGATGSHTIGFSFDKALLPNGNYLAQLLAECANDGMAIIGHLGGSESVPEPITGLIAAAAFGGAALGKVKKSKKNA